MLQPSTLSSRLTILLSASVEEGDARSVRPLVCRSLLAAKTQAETAKRGRVRRREENKETVSQQTKTGRE